MVYNSILEALSKLGGIKEWESIHVKVNMPEGRRHELYFSNPDYSVVDKLSTVEIAPEPVKPVVVETLEEKISRFRNSKEGELTVEEEAWFKERQKELEEKKIGQILPTDSMEVALKKLKKIGVK